MTDDRLRNLGVLSIWSRSSKVLNLEDFVDVFPEMHVTEEYSCTDPNVHLMTEGEERLDGW